jgi:16S rRNA (uracil1498-N3)-methyltransferase
MTRHVRVPLETLRAGRHSITGDAAHYLTRVLRLREGAAFTAFDPAARLEAEVVVVSTERDAFVADFGEPAPARVVGLTGVTLIQCAGKGDKTDDVVRAATALGASRIVVATSERSIARPSAAGERLARLRAIALDAARQSGRGDLPDLEGPTPLADVLAAARTSDAQKLCLEPSATQTLGAALRAHPGRPVMLLVGPEGGFATSELDSARAAGFTLVRFGSLVLRTELAGLAALGAVIALGEAE